MSDTTASHGAEDARQDARQPLSPMHAVLAWAAALLVIGVVGVSHAAIGYALFLIATLLLIAGVGLLAIFALTPWLDGQALRASYLSAFWMGGWTYVLAVAALAGYFASEALAGRVDFKLMVFGPAVLAALVVFDLGVWRLIVRRNLPSVRRFGDLWRREALDQPALRRMLWDEVILHRTLFTVSPFRWVRHQLIFWGFGLMFLVELAAVAFREALPSFGWTELWSEPEHPVRLAFDLAFELTGLMVLVGCVLALVFRALAEGTEQRKYADTPTAAFLLVVVLTGFVVEGVRIALAPDAPGQAMSFVGRAFAQLTGPVNPVTYDMLWLFHALLACAFIAYVPLKRMIHSCATPLGRLAMSQRSILAAKKRRVVEGLARRMRR